MGDGERLARVAVILASGVRSERRHGRPGAGAAARGCARRGAADAPPDCAAQVLSCLAVELQWGPERERRMRSGARVAHACPRVARPEGAERSRSPGAGRSSTDRSRSSTRWRRSSTRPSRLPARRATDAPSYSALSTKGFLAGCRGERGRVRGALRRGRADQRRPAPAVPQLADRGTTPPRSPPSSATSNGPSSSRPRPSTSAALPT